MLPVDKRFSLGENFSMNAFSKHLSFQIFRHKISVHELSEYCNKSHRTILAYARGERVPNILTFMKIVECMNLQPNYLLGYNKYSRGGRIDIETIIENIELYRNFISDEDKRRIITALYG